MLDIISGAADLASGGVVGLLGSVATSVVGYFRQRQDHRQRIELRAQEHGQQFQMLQAEAKYRVEQLRVEQEGAALVAEHEALAESYKADVVSVGDSHLMMVAEFVRRMTRPVLTYVLLGLTGWVYTSSAGDVQEAIARGVVALTGMAVGWWFADRSISKQVARRML